MAEKAFGHVSRVQRHLVSILRNWEIRFEILTSDVRLNGLDRILAKWRPVGRTWCGDFCHGTVTLTLDLGRPKSIGIENFDHTIYRDRDVEIT